MTDKTPYLKAKLKAVKDLERGDIIAYQDFHSREWRRGIVYNSILSPKTMEIAGFRVLPVETVGLKSKAHRSKYDVLEKQNGSIVEQVGGTPGLNKTIVTFNIQTVANRSEMTGLAKKSDIWTVGSYWGSPYMVELLDRASDLYEKGELYMDGSKVEPATKINIIPSSSARRVVLENRHARNLTIAKMKTDESGAGTSFEQIAKDQPARPKASPSAPPKAAFKAAAKMEYDVNLKDLVLIMNMGGERLGLSRIRGGATNETEESKPIQDPLSPEKVRTLTTLREAWQYIQDISPERNISVIAETLQKNGGISASSAEKSVRRLASLFDGLKTIKESNGQMHSDNRDIQKLIARHSVIGFDKK